MSGRLDPWTLTPAEKADYRSGYWCATPKKSKPKPKAKPKGKR